MGCKGRNNDGEMHLGLRGPSSAQGKFYSFGREKTPEVSEPWPLRRHQPWWPGTGSAEAKKGHMSQEAGFRAKALRGELAAWC